MSREFIRRWSRTGTPACDSRLPGGKHILASAVTDLLGAGSRGLAPASPTRAIAVALRDHVAARDEKELSIERVEPAGRHFESAAAWARDAGAELWGVWTDIHRARMLGRVDASRTEAGAAAELATRRCRSPSAGWYVVGGTSASSPQRAGLVASADQVPVMDSA